MQKDRQEDQPAQPVRNEEPRSDGDAVEERVNDQSEQDRIGFVGVNEFVVMRFFTEVEMRRNRVFEEVNDQISQQNQKSCAPSAQLKTFWNHLDQGCGQHESRSQRDKVAQVAPLPMPLDNDRSAEDVCGSSGQA